MIEEETKENSVLSEQAKKLGNDAYLAKKYDEAITHYSEAIRLDPDNAVYYSNRSACYGSLKQWQRALEDALLCISKDPKFIKGFYRLYSAQAELKLFDDAENTLKAALVLEPGNEVVLKQLRNLPAKRAAAVSGKEIVKKPLKNLDDAQMKEVMELQEQVGAYSRDLRYVRQKLSSIQKDGRVNQVTASQLQSIDPSKPLYRSVGKAFVSSNRSEVTELLEKESIQLEKSQKDLLDRQEYLERRIQSNMDNLKDITSAV